MIKNFPEIKSQLRELATVINSFKSEAVQLRLIELVFEAAEAVPAAESLSGQTSRRRRRGRAASQPKKTAATQRTTPRKVSSRPGGGTTLNNLVEGGFFRKPKTIGQVVEHCEQNLALKYKQSDLSGPLARLTRDGKLKRSKNAEKQYEYVQA